MSPVLSHPLGKLKEQPNTLAVRSIAVSQLRITWSECGAVSLSAVLSLAVWIGLDPNLWGGPSDFPGSFVHSVVSFWEQVVALNGVRRFAMIGLLACAAISAIVWMTLFVAGRIRDRSIRSCMAFTGVLALWLACLGSWHDIAWLGKQSRAANYVESFKPIAEELRLNWPCMGGDHTLVGMYLAYPSSQPRSMILMSCPVMPNGAPSFNGVERTADNGLSFSMIGLDGGDWLEWHPGTSQPTSYTTGLQQKLKLIRFAQLEQGWYLVRYAPS